MLPSSPHAPNHSYHSHPADHHATSSPHPLLAHLSDSLLRGSCSDILVRIDQWGVEYRLHRMVLIQAGFFHSLFLGGFSEGIEGDAGIRAGSEDVKPGSMGLAPPNSPSRRATRHGLKETSLGLPGLSSGEKLTSIHEGNASSSSSSSGPVLALSFDDGNISRCAFEICISRLYSSHPTLQISPALLPSATYPLTPSFPLPPLLSQIHPPETPTSGAMNPSRPVIQPVSPRLLLSLLATSIYLGQNDLVRESLGLILGSVSPWSVGRYLGFAIGMGIGLRDGQLEGTTEDRVGGKVEMAENGARGMEGVARVIREVKQETLDEHRTARLSKGKGRNWSSLEPEVENESDVKPDLAMLGKALHTHRDSEDFEEKKVCQLPDASEHAFVTPRTRDRNLPSSAVTPGSVLEGDSLDSTMSHEEVGDALGMGVFGKRYFYGFGGDKIGEACVAWLARWGQDLLEVEEAQFASMVKGNERKWREGRGGSPFGGLESFSGLGVSPADNARSTSASRDRRSRSISFQLPDMDVKPTLFSASPAAKVGGTAYSPVGVRSSRRVSAPDEPTAAPLCVWGYGGLPAAWVRGIIASDEFFIENELARYGFAKRVMELRRLGKEHDGRRQSQGSELVMEEEPEDGDLSLQAESAMEEELWEAAELAEIFVSGIRFSHMTFEELKDLETDFNPETNQPYVPLAVLQAASWAALDLRGTISGYKSDGTFPTPAMVRSLSGSKVSPSQTASVPLHGLALTTTDIVSAVEVALRPPMPKWTERPGSPRVYGTLPRDHGNTSFSSGVSSPTGSPRRVRNPTANLPQQPSAADRFYWPVPVDNTIRIGDAASQSAAFYPFHPYPDLGPAASPKIPGKGENHGVNTGESNFFGFGSSVRSGREILEMSDDGFATEARPDALWSKYEPFRFSVEFWNVETLGEKERAYSKTVFHAGSYFNIYVQTLKKKDKGVQLGIYLHRQSMLEPLPAASKPSVVTRPSISRSVSPMGWNASSPAVHHVMPGPTGENPLAMHRTSSQPGTPSALLSVSPPVHAGAQDEDVSIEETATPRPSISKNAPLSPYRDPRKTSRVFFSVSCASAMGTALTRFSSGPDSFALSQSWGWRSSSLRSQEYLACTGVEEERLEKGVLGWISDVDDDWPKKNLHSLRASVVLGVL